MEKEVDLNTDKLAKKHVTTTKGMPCSKRKKSWLHALSPHLNKPNSTAYTVYNEKDHDARNCHVRLHNPKK
jgi:hypothetical protein